MSACEKCWAEAGGDADRYRELLAAARRQERPQCTSEEIAGPNARECPRCHRMTLHQYTGEPICGCQPMSENASNV